MTDIELCRAAEDGRIHQRHRWFDCGIEVKCPGLEQTAQCPDCGGAGMWMVCANDGTHGCSHTFDKEYRCERCDGDGEVPS